MIRKAFPAICAITTIVLLALVGTMLSSAASTPTQAQSSVCPWMDTSKSPDERAQSLIISSTLDQKIRWLNEQAANNPTQTVFSGVVYSGTQVDCTPIIQYTDGPWGVDSGATGITAFPVPIAQAASWDMTLSRQKGQAQGYEAFQKHRNVLLGPGLSSGRMPLLGRNSEYMGEDSLLAGTLAGAWIRGLQEDNPDSPVEAVIKHYVANEQELDRNNSSSNIDERTLHEIYALPFEIAIKEGNPGGVMCAFNQVNGVWSCESSAILHDILKTNIGFKGWVVSDFGSVHSTVTSTVGGLDQELNRPVYYSPANLKAALAAGQITEAQIDQAAFRVVRAHIAAGLFDHPLPAVEAPGSVSTPADKAVSLKMAEEGTVLLKNQGGILPLSGSGKTIAVIGPTASITPTGGVSAKTICSAAGFFAGSTAIDCPSPVAPLDAITARAAAGGNTVVFNNGSVLTTAATTAASADVAIVFGYYTEGEGNDIPSLSLAPQTNTSLFSPAAAGDTNIKIGSLGGIAVGSSIVVDTGASRETVKATAVGTAATSTSLAFAAAAGDTNIKVPSVGSIAVGDTLSIDTGGNLETVIVSVVGGAGGTTVRTATAAGATNIPVVSTSGFSVGQTITIDSGGNLETRTISSISMFFQPPALTVSAALANAHAVGVQVSGSGITFAPALSLAHASGAAVKDSGTGVTFVPALVQAHASGAAIFSSYGDDLISAVASANPKTIVVLETGGPVLMPWIDQVKGVLEAWYPGDQQGTAIAALLWGDVNPSGKLPQTFPNSAADLPTAGSTRQYPGLVSGSTTRPPGDNTPRQVDYLEGLQVGYRWYDAQNIEPLFPFGHGLSYSTFDYSGLTIRPNGNGFDVNFTVRNSGSVTGTEVPQVYVGLPTGLGEPPKRLVGWDRVTLKPGESQDVTVMVDPDSSDHPLSYWKTSSGTGSLMSPGQWVTPYGSTYTVYVGASSRDIRLLNTTQVHTRIFLPIVLR